ncbi:MAG: cadherin-like domain-containing protein, partial [Pirellulales bacterium]|nr:cadherin-like domain-containing protein [Pirellulales bacterium]
MGTAIEALEPRQLLAAHILATVDGSLLTVGETDQMDLNVAGSGAILGFRVQGTGGTLDPDAVVVKDLANYTIAPREANADVEGGTDSLVLAELGAGSFTVATRAENATTGAYRVDVFLPGDISGDGLVDPNELMRAQAAVIQSMGSWNHVTQAYYAKHGIDLTKNLYEQELDCDGDGRISNFDLGIVTTNAAAGPLSITLISDAEAPVIEAGLANDAGASATDGITNDARITGTIQDEHAVVEFLAGIDGMDPSEYVSVLAEVDAAGHFEFDLARLEDIAGASLANNGAHTLYLIATDEYDNVSDPFEVEFTLDTIAPEVPTGLDLIAASDLGFSNTDNVTADNTPTVTINGPSGAVIKLYSSVNGKVGQATAASAVSITASALSNGVHQLTATATDVAGNESAASTALAVTIDAVAPAVPTLALAAGDNTGNPDDNRTEKTSVRLEGATEAGARVTFNGTTTIDTATGVYGFDAIALAFGTNHFTISAMDLAGNVSNNSADVIQNNLPTLGTPVGPIDLNEDPGAKSYSLATLFNDANLAEGDTLTLSIANSNPTLFTASLSGTSGQIHNSQLQLVFGANKYGTAVLTITATDSIGEAIQTTITVNVAAVNDQPVAAADNYQVEVDGQLTVNAANGVLANDTDVEGTALTAVLGTTTQHGNLTLNPNGSFTYTPAAGYEGTDSFTYTASDGDLSSAETTVTIQVIANHLPTA